MHDMEKKSVYFSLAASILSPNVMEVQYKNTALQDKSYKK